MRGEEQAHDGGGVGRRLGRTPEEDRETEVRPEEENAQVSSPTARTLAECRKRGWSVGVVERWIPQARIRQDLFGFIDLVAMDGKCIYGIQSTSGSNLSARLKKIGAEPRALAFVESGGRILVQGWRKLKKTGRWEVREIEVTKEMLCISGTNSTDTPPSPAT